MLGLLPDRIGLWPHELLALPGLWLPRSLLLLLLTWERLWLRLVLLWLCRFRPCLRPKQWLGWAKLLALYWLRLLPGRG